MIKLKFDWLVLLALCLSFLMLLGVYRGKIDNGQIYFQTQLDTAVGSPFESSGSSSRYALTKAIVDQHTMFFDNTLAEFGAPDISYYRGKFFTIFTPGVSFLGVPLYAFGNTVGLPQLFAYLLNIVLGVGDVYLVYKLSRKLGAGQKSSLLSGLVFLFATNALAYSVTYTQHLASVFVLLLAIINSFSERTFVTDLAFGSFLGAGMLIDVPNIFMMLPVAFYVLIQHFQVEKLDSKIRFKIKLSIVALAIGLLPLLIFYGWYNHTLTGSYTKIGQFIGQSNFPVAQHIQNQLPPDKPGEEKNKPIVWVHTPFNTRNELYGFDTLLFSDQRGIFYYSPITLLGLLGLILLYFKKDKRVHLVIMASTILMVLLVYSMFDGPEGGWSFGARYMIPALSVLCAAVGISLDRFKKNIFFTALFIVLLAYSVKVSTLGVLTTNAVPPTVEAANLTTHIPSTYEYNLQLLDKNFSSSLFFSFITSKWLDAKSYYYIYQGLVLVFILTFFALFTFEKTGVIEHKSQSLLFKRRILYLNPKFIFHKVK